MRRGFDSLPSSGWATKTSSIHSQPVDLMEANVDQLTLRAKPANATYLAKVVIDPDGNGQMTPRTGEPSWFERVEIAWYSDRIKVTIPGGTPASISQAYLTGNDQDVIIEIVRQREQVRVSFIDGSHDEIDVVSAATVTTEVVDGMVVVNGVRPGTEVAMELRRYPVEDVAGVVVRKQTIFSTAN